jgi:hypothetical protein
MLRRRWLVIRTKDYQRVPVDMIVRHRCGRLIVADRWDKRMHERTDCPLMAEQRAREAEELAELERIPEAFWGEDPTPGDSWNTPEETPDGPGTGAE